MRCTARAANQSVGKPLFRASTLAAVTWLAALCACTTPARQPSTPTAAPTHERSQWLEVSWGELPGWAADRTHDVWPALLRGCERPTPLWSRLCAQALLAPPLDAASAREWLMQRFIPYRVQALDGSAQGLATGYFEPLMEASRQPQGRYSFPVHLPPANLAARQPYWTRQQLDTDPQAQAALRGREIAYLEDPLDVLVLQVQGSGRVRLAAASNTPETTVRLAYAGHNGQPFRSPGRWLIEQGELKPEAASWPAIKAWAQSHPQRLQELLWSNPRVVFFREEPLLEPAAGPRGAQGVALTPTRSIAVDASSIPLGSLVWLDTTEPLSQTPLQRLVLAQDTGSAIQGPVRADFFWGLGSEAQAQAGRMKQALRLWVLWPK